MIFIFEQGKFVFALLGFSFNDQFSTSFCSLWFKKPSKYILCVMTLSMAAWCMLIRIGSGQPKLFFFSRKLKVGSSHDDYMGPLVSKIHMDKVKGYINQAREEGGNIHCGEYVDELCLPSANEKVSTF